MGILSKLGITEEEKVTAEEPTKPTKVAVEETDEEVAPTPRVKSKRASETTEEAVSSPSVINKDLYKMLSKALTASATEGFDYLKFRDALHSMEKKIPDEEARFTAANAGAEVMKVKPDDLITSAQDYLDVLAGEKTKFTKALAERTGDLVDKQNELKKVKKDLQDLQDRKEELEKEVADSKVKTDQQQNDFSDAYDKITGEIKQDVSKIKKYLKNN